MAWVYPGQNNTPVCLQSLPLSGVPREGGLRPALQSPSTVSGCRCLQWAGKDESHGKVESRT